MVEGYADALFWTIKSTMESKFNYKGIIISCWVGSRPECILYCPGLPQYVSKYHPIVLTAKQLGVTLFVPRYRGTWESHGVFGVPTSVDTIDNTVDFIRQGAAHELFANNRVSWGSERILLVGFSYGALPALLCGRSVWRTALVAPFVNPALHEHDNPRDVEHTVNFLQRAYPNVYRFDPARFVSELSRIEYPDLKDNLTVLSGTDDPTLSPRQLEWLREHYPGTYLELPLGHNSDIGAKTLESLLS